MKLRGILILKQSQVMSCIIHFIKKYLSFLENAKEFWMRLCTKNIYNAPDWLEG